MELLTIIATKLILPLKILAMAVLAVFARIFHDKEKITKSIIATRIVMSLLVLLVSFSALREVVGLSEETSLIFSGGLAFAFREVMDTFLTAVKNPLSWKDVLKNIKKK